MGRKPVPAKLKRDNRLVVMVTDDEMATLERASEQADAESLSAWIRKILLAAARDGIIHSGEGEMDEQ